MATKPDLSDTLTALKMHLGKIDPDMRYDVDGSGVVDLNDVLGLQKAYLGKDPGFVFADNTFTSPVNKTVEDYARERQQAEEKRIADEKEAARQKALLSDAQKLSGSVTADMVAKNPSMTAQQLASLAQRNYWSNESEAFSRVMAGMENGTAQLKEVVTGADEWGYPVSQLAITTGEHPGYDTLYLKPTSQPNVYQFSTRNQVAGGNIHGVIAADPKTGRYAPVQDYTKQIVYTPGSPGGWARSVIGDLGDALKSMGPLPILIGNAILPGAGSALGAVLALDEGNTTGAVLNALSAGSTMGADAAQNALAAEISGNADLANQYSSGLSGTLAENAGNLKTASDAAQLANAVNTGNIGGALTAAGNLTGVSASPEIKTGMAVAGLAKALNNGDTAAAIALAGQLTGSQDAKVASQAVRMLDALNSGNMSAAISAGTGLAKTAEPYLKEAKLSSTLTGEDIDPSQFDAAELLFGTNAGSLGEASDMAGLTDTGADQVTQQDLVNIVTGGQDSVMGGEATTQGGASTDVIDTATGGQDSVMGGEATTQGGASTDIIQDDGTTTGIQDVIDTITGGDGTDVVADDGTTTGIQDVIDTLEGGDGTDTLDTTCADGFHWDADLQICVADTDETKVSTDCPDGYVYNVVTQTCEPITTDTGTGTKTGTGSTKSTTSTQTQQSQSSTQQPALTQQESPGLGLAALLALMGGGGQQTQPTQPALADTSGMVDIEELLANPLQTDYRKLANKPKMAEGGSIDDLLALLNQKG